MRTSNTVTVYGEHIHFPHGEVLKFYRLMEYSIVEYSKPPEGRVLYYAYVKRQGTGIEYESFDAALFGVLIYKYAAQEDFRKRVIRYFVQTLSTPEV